MPHLLYFVAIRRSYVWTAGMGKASWGVNGGDICRQKDGKNNEAYMYGTLSPCRCGKDNVIGGAAVPVRKYPQAGQGGQKGHLSGLGQPGAVKGHYHFFQAGPPVCGGCGDHPAGHAGTCGFFGGNGAHIAGAGRCRPGDRGQGRGAGAYPYPVEAAGTLSHPGFYFCE